MGYTEQDEIQFLKSLKASNNFLTKLDKLKKYQKAMRLRQDWGNIDKGKVEWYLIGKIMSIEKRMKR